MSTVLSLDGTFHELYRLVDEPVLVVVTHGPDTRGLRLLGELNSVAIEDVSGDEPELALMLTVDGASLVLYSADFSHGVASADGVAIDSGGLNVRVARWVEPSA